MVDTGFHGPSPILQPDGTPFPKTPPMEEVAAPQLAGIRALYNDVVASGLTPERLAVLLRESIQGDTRAYLTLCEEIEERDAHYASVLGTRKRALSGIRPTVNVQQEKDVDSKVQDAVVELVEKPNFPQLVEDMLDGLGKGYSALEIMWAERDGMWWPAHYVHRDPRYFTFDYISRTTLRLASLETIDGVDLPPAKFITHIPKLKTGIPIRGGLARVAVWNWLLKSFSLKDWAAFLDVYGLPLRVGKYHPAATDAERRKLLQAVASIASDAAAIIPESMAIEFIEAKSTGNAPFEPLARYMDEQISKVVLGQTMTADHGSSMAQAKVHNDVRLDIAIADGRQAEETINRDLISWFVAFNFGRDKKPPRVELPIPKPEDVKTLSGALAVLVPLGLKVAQDDVRERIGLPTPAEGAELLAAPASAPAGLGDSLLSEEKSITAANRMHVRGCQCGGCRRTRLALNAIEPEMDELDRIEQLATDDWEPQMT